MSFNTHKIGRLDAENCWFLICDMQDGFTPCYYSEILAAASRLIQTANVLNIPILCTEHEGWGKTRSELDLGTATVFSKTKFSMLPVLQKKLNERPTAKTIILFGVSADCCVLQTCLDLLTAGFEVHIVSDAVGSPRLIDSVVAIERMRNSGAYIISTQCIPWELIRDSDHPANEMLMKIYQQPLPEIERLANMLSK